MNEFDTYRALRDAGATAHETYRRGQTDGLDAIALLRLVRELYGLSLADAKRVAGAADAWTATPELSVGADVSWTGRDPVFGPYFAEATIAEVADETIRLDLHRLSFVTPAGLSQLTTTGSTTVPRSAIQRNLTERLAEAMDQLPEFRGIATQAV